MKPKYVQNASASILSVILLLAASSVSIAVSLSGNEGDKRFPPTLPYTQKAPCTKAYKAYIAAGGHSAYATTPYTRVRSLYIICGAKLNAPSQKVAEDLAMKSCEGTVARHRVTTGGACEIAASK
ncbi:MAG: hypothetical protein E5Y02_15695 [Mesorhizobium sp.]|nr:MAG: hypothetical protein E5Y02_15695 [Mesorhizobium sp.]